MAGIAWLTSHCTLPQEQALDFASDSLTGWQRSISIASVTHAGGLAVMSGRTVRGTVASAYHSAAAAVIDTADRVARRLERGELISGG